MPNARFDSNSPSQRRPRTTHLAACLATALGLGGLVTPAIAANIVVDVCSDADVFGPPNPPLPPLILFGLRSSVADANDGDTIDMTELSNCTITLTAGEIPITVNNLTFTGPTSQNVTIDAHNVSRVFDHTGTGQLELSHLTLEEGYSGPPSVITKTGFGGCIFSAGSLDLFHSTVTGCEGGYGSALYSAGELMLNQSVVTGNSSAASATNALAAIYTRGFLYAKYSQISNNIGSGAIAKTVGLYTDTTVNDNSEVGVSASGSITLTGSTIDGNGTFGVATSGPVTLNSSTVSNNGESGISIVTLMGAPPTTLTITNSTISGNYGRAGGGIDAYNANMYISNSTIAYNTADAGGGIYAASSCGNITINSSIIADNSVVTGFPQTYSDLDLNPSAFCGPTGSRNLIGVLSFAWPGTKTGPAGLTPLAYHGGNVRTHALQATSHALNFGSNPLNLAGDERGTNFPRNVDGTDIGAYERQVNDDEIFYNGFQSEP